jgi:hypothetical protein
MKRLPLGPAIVALCTGCATKLPPLDQATASAAQKKSPAAELARAEARIRGLTACPTGDFAPATPLSFLVAAMDSADTDTGKARALFRLYRDAGCDIHAPDKAGLRPIHSAILFRDPAATQFLLDNGADPAMPIEAPSKLAGKTGYDFAALVCANRAGRCPALMATLEQWKPARRSPQGK